MKGLLLKDLYVLTRQMRVFLLFIVVFSVIPGSNMTVFAVVYAAMMPYTALAYDERSHWEQMAGMMPYSTRQIVVSKYILGWIFTVCAAVVAAVAGVIETRFGLNGSSPLIAGLSLCVGIIMMDITLPPMFRLGVEKGRMFFIILMVLAACSSATLVSGIVESSATSTLVPLMTLALPVGAIVLTAISIPLSVKCYEKHLS
ncbi:MAG: ABC-2 transporter permease [Oscillibacter sp.]|jgi:hypothetical protein|nr:ABC-2 transporter permease [Oscillibacter sp.]